MRLPAYCLTSAVVLGLATPVFTPVAAQPSSPLAARDELLRLVPKEFGLCVVVHDLRGQAETLQSAAWLKKFKTSPLGEVLWAAPEWKHLRHFQSEIKKHLELDWPTLRDDILGDAVVFAFQPDPAGQQQNEQGVLLLRARKADLLKQTMERLDRLQKQSGEVKSLETREHKGVTYLVRSGGKGAQYYFVDGPVLAFAGKEDVLRGIIDLKANASATPAVIARRLERAGADKAFASMWINPRVFDAELQLKAKVQTGPEAVLFHSLLGHWQALDAIVVSVAAGENLEVRLSIQAREKDLPAGVKGLYAEPVQASNLWTRFPEDAVLSVAGRVDFAQVANVLAEFAPPEARQAFMGALKPLADFSGLDLMKKVVPSLGPDWGFAVLAADDPKQMPQVLAALAVKPGPKEAPVDQALFQGLNLLAGLAVLDHNSKNPNPLRMRSMQQDGADVRFVTGDKALPPGLQPAFALKDGYLLLATSPDAMRRFKADAGQAAPGEAPLVRMSTIALAKVLRAHRNTVIDHIATKNQMAPPQASLALDLALGALNLLERVEITQRSGGGQLAWTLRLRMAK